MKKNTLLIIFSILTVLNSLEVTEGITFSQLKGNYSSKSMYLSGFAASPYFNEQICTFNYEPEVRVLINAPSAELFDSNKPSEICIIYPPKRKHN